MRRLLFEADDAVLHLGRMSAGLADGHEADDGHDQPPDVEMGVIGPMANDGDDGEDDVEQEQRRNEEVPGRIEAGVVLAGLRRGHGRVLSV
jgi:hypothetical protein